MSTKSRKILRRTRRSLLRNSPLVSPSSASRKSKNLAAFEFESESVNSSLSSVFTDSEGIENKKKKIKTVKIRNTEDLTKDSGSTESTSEYETALKSEEDCNLENLPELNIKKSRSVRKNKRPLFTLPDITNFKSDDSDKSEVVVSRKTKGKRKIRYTQDLNAICIEKRDSDVPTKTKSKKTKKANHLSSLPMVDLTDSKKQNRSKSSEHSTYNSDNKENDTNSESTETEQYITKKGKSRSRRSKKNRTKNQIQQFAVESNEEADTSESTNQSKDNIVKNDLDNKNKNSTDEDLGTSGKINMIAPRKSVLNRNSNSLSVLGKSNNNNSSQDIEKNIGVISKRSSTRGNFITNSNTENSGIIKDIGNINDDTGTKIAKQSQLSVGKSKSKRDTFDICYPQNSNDNTNDSTNEARDIPADIPNDIVYTNKRKSKSSLNLSAKEGPTVSYTQSDTNSNEISTKDKSLNLEKSSNKLETSCLIDGQNFTKTRFSKRISGSVPNLDSSNLISNSNILRKTSMTASNTSTRRPSFISATNLGSSHDVSTLNDSVAIPAASRKSTRSSRIVARGSILTPKLKREETFEIHSTNPEELFKQDIKEISGIQQIAVRDTYDVVPSSKYRRTRSFKSSSSDENESKNITTIDLTESVRESTEPSPRIKTKTVKSPLGKRKSSFEISFKVKKGRNYSEDILDHLNITRRDSGKSIKKSSTGFKGSTGNNDEDAKTRDNFVTLTRGCHTMIDFDTGDSSVKLTDSRNRKGSLRKFKNLENLNGSKDKSVLVIDDKDSPKATVGFSVTNTETMEKPTLRKSILKKSIASNRRDTFEIVERYYANFEGTEKSSYQTKPTVPVITEVTPNVSLESGVQQDVFDLVSNTPTTDLGALMLGSGESVIVRTSFLDNTNQSLMPRLTRTSTFTKDEAVKTSPPERKSTRKRWSQVERTPIFNKMPNDDTLVKDDQSTSDTNTETNINKSKSVTIKTPPVVSPMKRKDSTPKSAVKGTKGKKSVKIETPVKTPKIRLHSPLVMRKTPKPDRSTAENSIISGNCAYKITPKSTPPSCTSTPYHQKKEVSLLQKVLTNEKNKSEKILNKNSVRTKMPNFSKIHQRQFEKMENLRELQERKAIRAQYLLSGTKPLANTSESRTAEKESRKQLKFNSPVKLDALKITGTNSTSSKKAGKANISKPVSKPLQHMLNKRASMEKKKKDIKSKVPVATFKTAVAQAAEAKVPKKLEEKGVTRLGFKLPVGNKNVSKDEQIKAVTTKSKIAVSRTEVNRNQLVGVRSNRRFELLMKMRENKK